MPGEERDERTSARVYVRTLADALEELHGRPIILSERDWERAREWHGRRIPLGLVLEILREQERRRPPRSLSAVARRVDEAWRVVESGRRERSSSALGADGPAETARPEADDPRVRAYAVAAGRAPAAACSEALRAAHDALHAGVDPGAVDRELDARLQAVCPRSWTTEAARKVDDELRRAGTSMPPAMRERTRERAVRAALRTRLGLPRSAD